jgi:hypothetical protein
MMRRMHTLWLLSLFFGLSAALESAEQEFLKYHDPLFSISENLTRTESRIPDYGSCKEAVRP